MTCLDTVVDPRTLASTCACGMRCPVSCWICCVLETLAGMMGITDQRELRVVDVTYGRGGFYAACRERIGFLAGSDIVRREHIVEPDLFVHGDSTDPGTLRRLGSGYHVLVVDPPYPSRISLRETERIVADNAGGVHAWRKLLSYVPVMASKLLVTKGFIVIKGMYVHEKHRLLKESMPGYWAMRYTSLEPLTVSHLVLPGRHRLPHSPYTNNASWLLVLRMRT